MATTSYSNLKNSSAAWNSALRNFGIVTVMNAKVYDVYNGMLVSEYANLMDATKFADTAAKAIFLAKINADYATTTSGSEAISTTAVIDFSELKANEIIALYLATTPIATLKYLKTANATQEGPTKTVTGGQNASPLIKYGKTARLEMQDALGNAEALQALAGLTVEYFRTATATSADLEKGATDVLHATTTFAGHKTVLGDTFIIDAKSGNQVPAYIIFYDFLSDSLLSLTQDAEGDATVFDMNGDLNEVQIYIGDQTIDTEGVVKGAFYTIMPNLDYLDSTKGPQIIVNNGISND